MQKKWNIINPNVQLQAFLSGQLGISSVLAQIFINRGLKTKEEIESFIKSDISSLHSPMLLPDIKKALRRIKKAIEKKEKVLIFGDYDVDGITSCALLKLTLKKLGLKTLHYLPHRIKEGYGINKEAIALAKNKDVSLFISVDCGVSNFKEIEELKSYNIDTIVVDHHEPHESLPKAYAIVNPKLKTSNYPFRDLAAVGVVYKLAQALTEDLLLEDLDLVCLGTIADVVPLRGENRVFVRVGLSRLGNTNKAGLQELIDACGLTDKKMVPHSVGFILGPRLNAAGRVSSPDISFDILTSPSRPKAEGLVQQLLIQNKKRQNIGSKMLDEALAKVGQEVNFKEHNVIVLSNEGWHEGVLGIIASRIADKFYRPTIIISEKDCLCRGSARSIKKFHMLNALSGCEELLETYGGHSHAAGISILKGNIEKFKALINNIAAENLEPYDLIPSLDIDIDVALKDINRELISSLDNLAPFGKENIEPVFFTSGLSVKGKPAILGRGTLKFWVSDGNVTYPAIGFRMSDKFDMVANSKKLDLAYLPSIDSWRDNNHIQLELRDIRPFY